MTADELLHLNIPDKRTELVKGQLMVREPAGYRHGDVAHRLARVLGNFVEAHQLGRVLAAETGFKIASNPDTVRAPDVAFITRHRLPDPHTIGFAEMAPDLAVEVLSPGDRAGAVHEKVRDWIAAGSQLVWVVNPVHRTIDVHHADGRAYTLDGDGALDGGTVVPGFTYALRDLLP